LLVPFCRYWLRKIHSHSKISPEKAFYELLKIIIERVLLDWIGLDWIGLDWIGLDWIGLDWIGLDWIGLQEICLSAHIRNLFKR